MSSTLQPNLLESLTLTQRNLTKPVEPGTPQVELPNLQSQVNRLASSISDETSRITVGKVLTDIVFLLDYLSLVESDPMEAGRIVERLSILHAVRVEASALVDFIENHATQLQGLEKSLSESLDGIAYAIKHEIRRIFDSELPQSKFDQDDNKVHGALLHAQGVLTNCFEQCMINLVHVFDERLNASRLFHDWQIRRERSLILARDLSELSKLIRDEVQQPAGLIVGRLRAFKAGSMQWLMYKDWYEYESLSEQVVASLATGKDTTHLLHRLGCYLETLLAHVKTRAVLADLEAPPMSLLEGVSTPNT